ncbi:MAG: hypothetical protein QOF76_2911 [Solirubrobacteraceae bacterium]|jgi:hypothetical protein|nr:hypothetical protein [Solirubrobacteraceae bacterium]
MCAVIDTLRPFGGIALALVLLAGCGGKKPPSAASVVKSWVDSVRTGDFQRANELFALPSVVFNGLPKMTLTKRAEVDAFNRSLPCGAELQHTQAEAAGHLLATFKLVAAGPDRPCTGSVGAVARVSFLVEDGKITEWFRESTSPPPGSQEA